MDPVKPPPLWTSIFGLSCVLIILLSALSLRFYYQSHYQQTSPDDVSSWKTFSDTKFNFTFKYPENYSLVMDKGQVIVHSPPSACKADVGGSVKDYTGYDAEITLIPHTGKSYADIWKTVFKFDLNSTENSQFKQNIDGETTVDGKNAKYFYQGAEMVFSRTAYLIKLSPTSALEINLWSPLLLFGCDRPLDNNSGQQISKAILSSIKFTDVGNILDWKIYSDELRTYQIKAPADWKQDLRSPEFIDMHFITLRASDDSTFQSGTTNAKNQTLTAYLRDSDQKSSTSWEGQPSKNILSTKNVTRGSFSGIERVEQWLAADYTTVVTYLKAGDYVYDFSIQPGDIKYENTKVYENYSQIVSTFQLTDNLPSRTVKLYYTADVTNSCEAKSFTESQIPISQTPITDTLKLLISGWNSPPEFYLKSVNLKNGILTLEFPTVYGFTTGGSCHIQSLTSAIINTAQQFPEVKEVIFDPEVFQP